MCLECPLTLKLPPRPKDVAVTKWKKRFGNRKMCLSCVKYTASGESQAGGERTILRSVSAATEHANNKLSRDLSITPCCQESMIVRWIILLLLDACCFTYSKNPLTATINNTEAMWKMHDGSTWTLATTADIWPSSTVRKLRKKWSSTHATFEFKVWNVFVVWVSGKCIHQW
jgi:hypothetical protein